MSCTSSDDENLELLKEAQDSQFLNDSLFSGNKEKSNSQFPHEVPVSLRKSADDEDYNFFKVTPEFRSHVAKHLSSLLDKNLKRNLEYKISDEITKKRQKKGGVKLFSDSEKYLKVETVEILPKKLYRAVESRTKVDKDSLKQLSVSGEDILAKKGTERWSNRTKAQVFQYKKTSSGNLVLIE